MVINVIIFDTVAMEVKKSNDNIVEEAFDDILIIILFDVLVDAIADLVALQTADCVDGTELNVLNIREFFEISVDDKDETFSLIKLGLRVLEVCCNSVKVQLSIFREINDITRLILSEVVDDKF